MAVNDTAVGSLDDWNELQDWEGMGVRGPGR
jgi:hypothetical protein